MPKLSKSHSTDIEKDNGKTDEPSVTNDEFSKDKKAENKPYLVSEKENLSEKFMIDMEMVGGDDEQKVLDKIEKLEARLKAEEKERKKTGMQVKELNKKISDMMAAEAVAAKPGAGYLSEGSTIELGIIDGDEELKVLEKVKRLEIRLEEEENKVKSLNIELTDLQSAKESVENDFANTKKLLQEKNSNQLKKINALESTLEEVESRAIAAEQELSPIKKELLKAQISDTKAQQELYKLKIEKLKRDEE
jgi:chromosome segregation ATPase